jgi:beta-lactamase regulating signal transducer with metallopeptidase domain
MWIALIEQCNLLSKTWGRWMGSSILGATIVLAVVSLLWLVIRRKASPQLGYLLFLLVPLKLFVPLEISVPERLVSWMPSMASWNIGRQLTPALPPSEANAPETSAATNPPSAPRAASMAAPTAASEDRATVPENAGTPFPAPDIGDHSRLSVLAWLMLGWALGVLILLARLIHSQIRFHRLVMRNTNPIDSGLFFTDFGGLLRRIRVGRQVRIVESGSVSSPVIWGIFRPMLILPSGIASSLSAGQLEWVLLHELAHVRRRDLAVRCFQCLAGILHFVNPAIWIAYRMINRLREYACDDMALAFGNGSQTESGEAFLGVMRYAASIQHRCATNIENAIGVFESTARASCFDRMKRLLDTNRRVTVRLGMGSICVLLLTAALALPQIRAANRPTAEEKAAEKAAEQPAGKNAVTIYDPVADYDAGWKTGKNPNGVWTYGWSSKATSPLHPYTRNGDFKDYFPNNNFDSWIDPKELSTMSPSLYKNAGEEYIDNNIDIPAGALILHGGGPSGNDFSHVVWTAPHNGRFSLDARFLLRKVPTAGSTSYHPTNVIILVKGKILFESHLKYYGEKCSDSAVFPLIAGDTIDFAVGSAETGLQGESTQLEAKITEVAEPVALPSARKHVRELARYLDGVKIAEPIIYRQLSVYPLLVADVPLLKGPWLTLEKALSQGIVDVREKAERRIDLIQIENHSPDANVFIMYGDVIVGGMQTRAVRQDVVLAPGQKTDLLVFAVEFPRPFGERQFSGGSKTMLPQSILLEIRKCADQERIYADVSRVDLSLDAENASESIDVALKSTRVRKKLEEVRQRIIPQIPGGAVGFLFVDHGRAVGADFLGSRELARELLPKLLDSYVVDCVLLGGSDSDRAAKNDRRVASDFLERVRRSGSQLETPLGSGDGLCSRGNGLMGDGVSFDEMPVHFGVQTQLGKFGEPNKPNPEQGAGQ